MIPNSWLLTPGQREVVRRLGHVRIGQRVYGDEVYIYLDQDGSMARFLLSGAGEIIRKDDLAPREQASTNARRSRRAARS